VRRAIHIFLVGGLVAFATCLAVPYLLPTILEWIGPGIVFRGNSSKKIIYLTIDDVPSGATDEILAVLARHKVSATFFVISGRIKADGELAKLVQAGHHLGHHMRTTTACSKLSREAFKKDFDSTDAVLKQAAAAIFFRPPSDFGTIDQLAYARSKGYTPILGTVFPLDHWVKQKWLLVVLAKWLAVPGGILIMHDGGDRGAVTAAVLDEIIPAFRNAGYEFGDLNSLAVPHP
jgi:peptidoglycan/xylan/chitin deacetylase (PgdA/CDA1 family)